MDVLNDLYIHILLTTPLVGAYMMFALGIVFIYRGSKVLNLAHGAMAMVPAYIAYSLAGGVGVIPATLVAVAAGAMIGLAVERSIVRRLRHASSTAQTVGTVGALGLLIALAARIWGTTPTQAPSVFPDVGFSIGHSVLTLGDLGLFITALVLAVGFLVFFRLTDLGLALRCSADNRRAAWLMGINPDRTTSIAWILAGVLAGLGGVLLGASTNLHPYNLSLQVLPAFVAALIGGLESESGAIWGSLVVGLTLGIVPAMGVLGNQVGTPQVALAVLAFVVMSIRGARFSITQTSDL